MAIGYKFKDLDPTPGVNTWLGVAEHPTSDTTKGKQIVYSTDATMAAADDKTFYSGLAIKTYINDRVSQTNKTWVDQVLGNDLTGVWGNQNHPFATYNAAAALISTAADDNRYFSLYSAGDHSDAISLKFYINISGAATYSSRLLQPITPDASIASDTGDVGIENITFNNINFDLATYAPTIGQSCSLYLNNCFKGAILFTGRAYSGVVSQDKLYISNSNTSTINFTDGYLSVSNNILVNGGDISTYTSACNTIADISSCSIDNLTISSLDAGLTNTVNVNDSKISGDIILTGPYSTLTIDKSSLLGAANIIYTNGATSAQIIISDEEANTKNWVHTGLISGGALSINGGDDTKFDVAAGSGIVMDMTNAAIPVPTFISWTAQAGLSTPYLATLSGTWVGYSKISASIVTSASDFTVSQLHNDIIRLGRLSHFGNTVITGVYQLPLFYYADLEYQCLGVSFGVTNLQGNSISANGANLKINKSQGMSYRVGANVTVDANNPNYPTTTDVSQVTFIPALRSATPGRTTLGAPSTDLNPAKYDDGSGTLQNVTSGYYTIQTALFFPANGTYTMFMLYGQAEYATFTAAIEALTTYSPVIESDISGGNIRAFIVIKEGTTDLEAEVAAGTAYISGGSLFGTFSGGGGGGGGGSFTPDHNSLAGLQGGAASEYFHIKADEYDAIHNATTPSASNLFITRDDLSIVGSGTSVFYVSKDGNDSNPGTSMDLPFLTVGAAYAAAKIVGTSVTPSLIRIIDAGIYSENIVMSSGEYVNFDIGMATLTSSSGITLTIDGTSTTCAAIVVGGKVSTTSSNASDSAIKIIAFGTLKITSDVISSNASVYAINNLGTTGSSLVLKNNLLSSYNQNGVNGIAKIISSSIPGAITGVNGYALITAPSIGGDITITGTGFYIDTAQVGLHTVVNGGYLYLTTDQCGSSLSVNNNAIFIGRIGNFTQFTSGSNFSGSIVLDFEYCSQFISLQGTGAGRVVLRGGVVGTSITSSCPNLSGYVNTAPAYIVSGSSTNKLFIPNITGAITITSPAVCYLDANTIQSASSITGAYIRSDGATSAATASKLMLRDSSANTKVNALVQNYTSTATSGGTTSLTVSSAPIQKFTGSASHTIVLPDATTLATGWQYTIINGSSNSINIQNNSTGAIQTIPAGVTCIVTCADISTSSGIWDINIPTSNAQVGTGIIFYLDKTDILAAGSGNSVALKTLLKTPAASSEATQSVVVNSNTLPIGYYWYNYGLGGSQIDAGLWQQQIFSSVSVVSGVTTLKTSYMKVITASPITVTITGSGTSRTATASSGIFVSGDANADITLASYIVTPTGIYQITAFSSSTVVTIATPSGYVNESAVAFYKASRLFGITSDPITETTLAVDWKPDVEAAFSINSSDSFMLMVYATTTSASNVTVTISTNGTIHNSTVISPLITRHNDLSAIQGGDSSNRWHLSFDEYNAVHDANSPSATNVVLTQNDVSTLIPAQDKIIYRAKNGNDANSGNSIDRAVASINQALTNAAALSPSSGNQVAIVDLDGDQDANANLPAYVHLFAPNMRLTGTSNISNNSKLLFREYYYAGGGAAFVFTGGTGGNSFLKGQILNNGYVQANTNQGTNFIDIDYIIGDSSYAITCAAGSVLKVRALKITGLIFATGAGSIIDLSEVGDVSGCTFSITLGGKILYPTNYFVNNEAGKTTINDSTEATSSAGSLVSLGGASFAKKIYSGSTTDASAGAGAIWTAGGISSAKQIYAGDWITATKGVAISGYNRVSGSGGDSTWHMQGQFTAFGDGVSVMYNMYADPSTGAISYPTNYYSSRVHVSYDYIAFYLSSAYSTNPTQAFSVSRNDGFRGNFSYGIILPAQSGGTASSIDYYERTTFTATFSCAVSTGTVAVTISVVNSGPEISLHIPAITLTGNTAIAGTLKSLAVIPTRFRPTAAQAVTIACVYSNTTKLVGTANIGSNGDIEIYYGVYGTNFPVTNQTYGTLTTTIQYIKTSLV